MVYFRQLKVKGALNFEKLEWLFHTLKEKSFSPKKKST